MDRSFVCSWEGGVLSFVCPTRRYNHLSPEGNREVRLDTAVEPIVMDGISGWWGPGGAITGAD